MSKKDARVDVYINKSADFAKPVLDHIRRLVHKACPDVEETIKWGFPHFEYKGVICSMAAFKQHCAFGFWKASLMSDPNKIINPVGKSAMGDLGKITSLKDLPSDKIMLAYLQEAVKLNEEGVQLQKKVNKISKREITPPNDFLKALKKNKKAQEVFENFSPSHKKEYVGWITEAKREETRAKRIAAAIEWISQGKGRNWKYERK